MRYRPPVRSYFVIALRLLNYSYIALRLLLEFQTCCFSLSLSLSGFRMDASRCAPRCLSTVRLESCRSPFRVVSSFQSQSGNGNETA